MPKMPNKNKNKMPKMPNKNKTKMPVNAICPLSRKLKNLKNNKKIENIKIEKEKNGKNLKRSGIFLTALIFSRINLILAIYC